MHKFLVLFIVLSHSVHSQSVFDLARSGTADEMKTYLNKNPEHLNLISEHGSSPFLLAAYRGNNEVATLLVEMGADLSYCYSEGSAVYALIYKNNVELLELLLKKGVNVNDTCQFEQLGYPIHFAITLKRYEIIDLLLKNNVVLDVKDQQNRTISQLLSLHNDPKLYELFP